VIYSNEISEILKQLNGAVGNNELVAVVEAFLIGNNFQNFDS